VWDEDLSNFQNVSKFITHTMDSINRKASELERANQLVKEKDRKIEQLDSLIKALE